MTTTADDWTIIFWNTEDHRQWVPTMPYRWAGESIKAWQDRIAEVADTRPHIIYMMVTTAEWREFFDSIARANRKAF